MKQTPSSIVKFLTIGAALFILPAAWAALSAATAVVQMQMILFVQVFSLGYTRIGLLRNQIDRQHAVILYYI